MGAARTGGRPPFRGLAVAAALSVRRLRTAIGAKWRTRQATQSLPGRINERRRFRRRRAAGHAEAVVGVVVDNGMFLWRPLSSDTPLSHAAEESLSNCRKAGGSLWSRLQHNHQKGFCYDITTPA